MLLKGNKPLGAGRGNGGNNKPPLAYGRGATTNRPTTSQSQAQGSSQPGRIYAITNEA